MTTLLNKAKVKKLALRIAEEQRAHKFTRVSPDFLQRIEAGVYAMVLGEVKRLPSLGKTIR